MYTHVHLEISLTTACMVIIRSFHIAYNYVYSVQKVFTACILVHSVLKIEEHIVYVLCSLCSSFLGKRLMAIQLQYSVITLCFNVALMYVCFTTAKQH